MDGRTLMASNVGPLAELLERIVAEAVTLAREEGYRTGYAAGQREEREAWRARMWAMLADAGEQPAAPEQDTTAGMADAAASERPPTEAGETPVKAAAEEAGGDAGAATVAPSCEAPAPQPIGEPSNAGGEPSAPPEPPAGDDQDEQDGQPSGAGCVVPMQDPGPASVAAAGASPEAPGASPAVSAPLWEDWRTPAREVVLWELWPRPAVSMKAIFQALALIDGPKMPSDAENARHWGKKLGLGARPAIVAPAPAPVAESAPEPDHVRETAQMVRARELLAMGLHPNDIRAAVKLTAVEFGEVCRLHKPAA